MPFAPLGWFSGWAEINLKFRLSKAELELFSVENHRLMCDETPSKILGFTAFTSPAKQSCQEFFVLKVQKMEVQSLVKFASAVFNFAICGLVWSCVPLTDSQTFFDILQTVPKTGTLKTAEQISCHCITAAQVVTWVSHAYTDTTGGLLQTSTKVQLR